MLQLLSSGIVTLYLATFFVLGFVYAIPHLQTKFKVSSKDAFNAILVTILYTLSLVTLFYVAKESGIAEFKLFYNKSSKNALHFSKGVNLTLFDSYCF
jgi:hypothetical protein